MSKVTIRSVQKSFGTNTVVRDFNLTIGEGEFISLLGPSGCGKTTVLRMVAGFETPSSGTIEIDGQDVTQQRPNQRRIGMMFQSYALFPNLNVAGNVGFGLKVAGMAKAEAAARVEEMLGMVGLKQSAKNVAPDARNIDHSLRNFSSALGQDAAETTAQTTKAKWLDADDLFYLGFHFAEQFGQEREFGVAVLKHLVKASKGKAAAAAKNKLKSLGVK